MLRNSKQLLIGMVVTASIHSTVMILAQSSPAAQAAGPGPSGTDLVVAAVHEEDERRFRLSATEIPSGWTTIKFVNLDEHATHFIYMNRLNPSARSYLEAMGDVTRETYMEAVSLPFQEAWDPFFQRDIDVFQFVSDLVDALPPWYFAGGIRVSGGPGLLAAGETSKTTQHLEPGTYAIECYMLGQHGEFHSTQGMVELLEVTEQSSGSNRPKPRPTIGVTISKDAGIAMEPEGSLRPGMHTFSVTFKNNMVYAHGLGHDVHLIRLDGTTTLDGLNDWMNLMPLDGLLYDADKKALTSTEANPGPQTFLGGVQDIQPPLPETAYFHAVLKPGEYALVAEVPDPKGKDMLKTFTVVGQGGSRPVVIESDR